MENKICALTEVSDSQIHLTRTAIYSFLEHNRWFDGTLYLIVLPNSQLSNQNSKFLFSIYSKLEFISSQNNPLLEYVFSKNKSFNSAELVQTALKTVAFDLPEKKVLYFSNSSLFLKDVSSFLKPNSIVLADSNLSIFYNSLTDSSTVFPSILSNIKNSNILSSETINRSIYVSLSALPEHRIESEGFYASSYFNDKRYNQLKLQLNTAKHICFSNVLSNSSDYSKITSVWLQQNKKVGTWLASPLNQKNVRASRQAPIRKPIVSPKRAAPKKITLNSNRVSNDLKYDHEFCVCITTYNRHLCVSKLTSRLKEINPSCKIVVVDDATPNPIDTSNIDVYVRNSINNGKKKWWKTVNLLWKIALTKFNSKYYIMLPDDALPRDSFFEKAKELWNSISDPNKIALHLANNDRSKNWTNFDRINYNDDLYLTQTTEFSFMCLPEFIQFTIPPIPENTWKKNPRLGSGVGQRLNSYWVSNQRNIYGVKKSLISSNDLCPNSVMNYAERKINPWIIK